MVLPEFKSSRRVPAPSIPVMVIVKLVPLVAERPANVPTAEPVVERWKSAGVTAYTVVLKTIVNATLLAVVGPGVLGVSETTVGGV